MGPSYPVTPGKAKPDGPGSPIRGQLSDFLALAEKYPGEKTRTLLPLTRLTLELLAWAHEAPETRPGP